MMTYSSITKKQSADTLIVFALMAIFMGLHTNQRYWFFAAGGFLFLTLLWPSLFKPLAYVWFGFSKSLGWLTSRIVVSLLFFVLVTPVGLIRRLMGKDTLHLKAFKKNRKTAFVDRNHVFTAQDLTYPF